MCWQWAILGFEFITSQFKSIINGSGKLEDKLADVQRVTSMTKDEVKALNKSLKEIDTRTAQQQLLDYAVTAGKLGVATAEIKAFVQSTDMLVTALGDELGDAATITDNLGKIINVYDGAGKITGERTLQIGNAIVALANAGVASGGFIVDFTKRLGGLAGTANIALESSVGMAAGLEELGQSAETSSTAISTVLVKIGTDLPKYARLAGKDVNDFSKTLRTSPMEALIQLAEGLKKNKGGFDEIASAFKEAEAAGGRVVSTLGAIGNNGEFLRGKMKDAGMALQETSEINNAFALKNITLGATLDKLGKEFNRMVTSPGVVNFLKDAVEGTLEMIKSIRQLPDWIERNRTMMILLAGAIGIYTRAKIAKMVVDAKDYIVLTAMYTQDKAMLIIRGLQTVATRVYATAVQLMTGQITLATVATRIFNGVATGASGIVGIVIAVLTTAAALWSAFGQKVKESTKSLIDWSGMMNEAAQNAGKEIGQLQQLYTAVNNVAIKQDDRRAAYDKMQELYPSLLKNMSYEDAIAGGLAKKYQELQKAIMGKYIIQASEGAISKLGQELFEVESALQGINESLEGSSNLQSALSKIGKDGYTNKETIEFQKGYKKSLDNKKKTIEDGFKSLSEFQEKLKVNMELMISYQDLLK
ncbi:MAG: phage tail tape measure protein [Bacteroidetes bacterium]|nr:phage tail tape measure protein [Bacteroidota bacterium]